MSFWVFSSWVCPVAMQELKREYWILKNPEFTSKPYFFAQTGCNRIDIIDGILQYNHNFSLWNHIDGISLLGFFYWSAS